MGIKFFGSTIRETVSALSPTTRIKIDNDQPVGAARIRNHSTGSSGSQNGTVTGGAAPRPARPAPKEIIRSANPYEDNTKTKAIVRIILTFLLLGLAIFLLVKPSEDSKALPGTLLGAIIGYWLK